MADSPPLISIADLSKVYDTFLAVDRLTFEVHAGQVLGLVGPNGAGKTTTLRCITGLIPPTNGKVSLAGFSLATQAIQAKQRLAFFPDEPRLFEHLTVWQHLNFIARLYQVPDFEPRATALLSDLALSDQRESLPRQLSRGMKQKLVLACGLLHRPTCVVFDEPLTGLDPGGIRSMKVVIRQLAAEGAAIVLSSHLLSLLEEVCSHVLILKGGRKIAYGTLDEVRTQFSAAEGASLEDVFFQATGGETAKP